MFVHCGLMSCISLESSYFLLSSQLSPSSLSLYFWMKQTFCICDLEGGRKKSLNLTSQMRRKEVVKAFWGETCPWTGCVNDWTGRQEKKIIQHLLSVFWLTCSFVEHEWHLRFIPAWKCVCGEGVKLEAGRCWKCFWFLKDPYWVSRRCLFVYLGLCIWVFVSGLNVTWKIQKSQYSPGMDFLSAKEEELYDENLRP